MPWHKSDKVEREKPASNATSAVAPSTNSAPSKMVVKPARSTQGRIASVNLNTKFAVLYFPLGNRPSVRQKLSIYRTGQKVGEVKVTGPQKDFNIVADLTAGEAQANDEVKAE